MRPFDIVYISRGTAPTTPKLTIFCDAENGFEPEVSQKKGSQLRSSEWVRKARSPYNGSILRTIDTEKLAGSSYTDLSGFRILICIC